MTTLVRLLKLLKIASMTVVALGLGLLAGKTISAMSSDGSASAGSLASGSAPSGIQEVSYRPSAPDTAPAEPARPTISNENFERMARDIRRACANYPGGSSIYIKNLETGREWSHNANRMVPSASLIKVPVMIGVFEKISKGELSLDQTLTLTKAARKSGSGHLKWRRNGEQFTVRELLQEMMAVSDNIAQEMLIRAVGIEYLQARFPKYGLSLTNITRQGLSLAPRTRVENYTTAREMGILLDQIYGRKKFGEEASAEMIDLMKHAKYNDRLTKHLPDGWVAAHKTGLLRRACHDVGIVYSPSGDYIICILTSNAPSYRIAKRFISKVGAISYKYFDIPAAPVASSSTLVSSSTGKS